MDKRLVILFAALVALAAVGLLLAGLVGVVPILGGLVQFVVLLLGLMRPRGRGGSRPAVAVLCGRSGVWSR